jgi:hypothetical protein
MLKFFRLWLLRPFENFLTQWIRVSTEPTKFVQERIRLGDTTNFVRAGGFFLSAISSAFLAEVATLYPLGIGNLTEPYYWLFILLTSIPFVLICFLLVRLVAPLSFKDVLHLSCCPVGAGVFTGAIFALIASTVVALLVAVGYISDIKYDFSEWVTGEGQMVPSMKRTLHEVPPRGRPHIHNPLNRGSGRVQRPQAPDRLHLICATRCVGALLFWLPASLWQRLRIGSGLSSVWWLRWSPWGRTIDH